jgi:hypothetical protein
MVERDAVVGNEIGFFRKPDLTEIVVNGYSPLCLSSSPGLSLLAQPLL